VPAAHGGGHHSTNSLEGGSLMSTSVEAVPTATAVPRRRPQVTQSKRRQYGAAYVLVLPFFAIFVAMIIVPLIYAGYLSFFKKRLIGGTSFAGFDNYVRALTDPLFLSGVARMGVFLVVQVPIMLALSLFFALALDSGMMKLAKFSRLAIFVPYAVPGVVATLMWGYLYGPDFGPFAQITKALGFGPPPFFSQTGMLFSIMNIVNWAFIGYNMILLYAALRSIPSELYEAARVDGASEKRIAWSIKIPAIRPALLLTVIFSVIGTFQLFTEAKLMFTLAPNVIGTAWTPNLYAYNVSFVNQDANYAAALAFLLGIVIMIVSYIVQLSTQRRERRS
jgi:multiple sugar transport system permease protein